jgi:hypothetical protein
MHKSIVLAGIAALSVPALALGTIWSENFDIDPTANWTVNGGPSDETANFFFDYSSVGIPSAPNSAGTTRGMKLQANLTDGIFGGFSVSPTGQSFIGDYTLRFDWWANFNGPFPGGGNGSTNLSTFGAGTSGTVTQWPGGTQDSVWFGATGDGGSAADYRAYSSAAPTSYPSGNAVYAAPGGAINNTNAYYSVFGGVTAPAAQVTLFPQQTGTTQVGAAGMQWHDVEIRKYGSTMTWLIDGLLIATIDLNTVTLGGNNIFFGHSDINATSSNDPNDVHLLFTLIDNVRVIPEPSSLSLVGLAAAMGLRRRR